MSEEITIARPYAEAVFALAQEQAALPIWAEMLRVAASVAADSRMRLALANPRLNSADKESLFLSICGDKLNADGRSFIRVLIEGDRVLLLPHIRELFDTLKNSADGVARATIDSAYPLSEQQLALLTAALERKFGKKVEPTVHVNPNLIGGVRIAVGDTVIDASVRSELQAMANQLRS